MLPLVWGSSPDEHARDYVPYIFGRGAFAILPDLSRLPKTLPSIYRQVTS